MRTPIVCLALLCACGDPEPSVDATPPASLRARMTERAAALAVSPSESAGIVTALRRVGTGRDDWSAAIVDLSIERGELVFSADASGAVTVAALELALAPIPIPLLGRTVALTNVRAQLVEPTIAATRWTTDDRVVLDGTLGLHVTWALTVDGTTAVLGAPDLAPVPFAAELVGDGASTHADLRILASGELWSWASLVALRDLSLVLDAR